MARSNPHGTGGFIPAPAPTAVPLRLLLAAVAGLYAWLVISGHDLAQEPALRVESRVGTAAWNRMSIVAALLSASVFTLFWLRRVWTVPPRPRAWAWAAAGCALALLSHGLLMIKSIEFVHFVQYGLLTWLLVPVVGRTPEAALVAFLVGMVDEAYQYSWLHRDWQPYLDWNDVVLNLLGCILAASAWSAASRRPGEARAWYRFPAASAGAVLLAVVATSYSFGWIGNYADTGRYPLQRWNRPQHPVPYVAWSEESGRRYHRLRVWEAWAVIALVGGTFVVVRCDG